MNIIRKIVASTFVMFCVAVLSVMAQDDYYDMAIDGYVRNPRYVAGVDGPDMSDCRIYLEDGKVKVAGEGVKDVNIITISGIKLNSSNKIPSKGVYLVRVVTDSGNVKVSKLVIK